MNWQHSSILLYMDDGRQAKTDKAKKKIKKPFAVMSWLFIFSGVSLILFLVFAGFGYSGYPAAFFALVLAFLCFPAGCIAALVAACRMSDSQKKDLVVTLLTVIVIIQINIIISLLLSIKWNGISQRIFPDGL